MMWQLGQKKTEQSISKIPPKRTRRLGTPLKLLLQWSTGVALLILFLRQIDMTAAWTMLTRANMLPVAIGLLAYLADFLLRSVRFWMLMVAVAERRLPLRSVPAPFIASFGISDLLPLRAGDVFRLIWFQRQLQLRVAHVFGAMIIERFYDLATLLLLGSMLAACRLTWPIAFLLPFTTALVMLAAPLILSWCIERMPAPCSENQSLGARVSHGLHETAQAFAILRSPVRVALLTSLSLICWLLEAVLFLGAWKALGGRLIDWQAPMTAFVASTLGTLVPGLPGHFGTFELFGLEAFTRNGIGADTAAAVLLLAHLMLWAPTALFAIAWLPFSGKTAKQPDSLLPQGGTVR
jgi:uncharacterized protein (TIRG00374 family)